MAAGVEAGSPPWMRGLGDGGEAFGAHEDHLGAMGPGDLVPVEGRIGFGGILMTGDHGERGGITAMGQGDAGGGGYGTEGGDAGYDFEGDAGGGEVLGFLATAAEDEGIATFQADDVSAGAGMVDEELVDLGLGEDVVVATFSGQNDFGGGGGKTQQGGIEKGVMDHDLGAGEQVTSAKGQQSGITGAGADEVHSAHGR
jgi:hypothetical protein